ncbi:MAG: CPBP family intramembrane metalloprotease [Ectothiorhodospiraceae bacterium]|nr:CPBP family intramembrane metalloprotease [Ectothiorhodospiraceae bacterium]
MTGPRSGAAIVTGFVVWLVAAPVVGALLAPAVHALLGALGLDAPFQKVAFRTMQVASILALVPLLRWLGLRGRVAWGLGAGPGPRPFAAALLAGIAMLALVGVCHLWLGTRVPRADVEDLGVAVLVGLAKGLVTGLVVALVEEAWFRGALHSYWRSGGGRGMAIWVPSVLYAVVHFVRPDVQVADSAVAWASGLAVLAGGFSRLADPEVAGPMVALVLAGAMLGSLRERSGAIWLCIAVHAGWVAAIRAIKAATTGAPDAALAMLATGYDGIVGWLAVPVLALALWCVSRR